MKVALSLFIALLLAVPTFAGNGRIKRNDDPVPNSYIVDLVESVKSADATAHELARLHGGKVGHVYRHTGKGFSIEATEEQALEISNDPRVLSVEEDGHVYLLQVPTYPANWGVDRINQHFLPLDGSLATGCNSAVGVTAYVLDSGVNPNSSEFGTRLVNGFTYSASAGYGGSHGTSVASIIGGSTYGVAKGVTLVNVKVLSSGSNGTIANMIAGVDYIAGDSRPNPTKVVNVSLLYSPAHDLSDNTGTLTSLDQRVLNSIQAGITYVVGAGNGVNQGRADALAIDACDAGSPARLGRPYYVNNPGPYSTITVSATMLTNNLTQDARVEHPGWWFANYGDCVDLFAPGDEVDTISGKFRGTSAATPYVTGVAARELRINVNNSFPWTPAQIEDRLKYTLGTQGVVANAASANNIFVYAPYAKCRAF